MKLFDRKISDTTTRGFNFEEIVSWFDQVKTIDEFKYYFFAPGARRPTESQNLKSQTVTQVLSFLNDHFMDSSEAFTEIQKKVFKSGRHEVIFRSILVVLDKREITKLAVLSYSKPISRETSLDSRTVVR